MKCFVDIGSAETYYLRVIWPDCGSSHNNPADRLGLRFILGKIETGYMVSTTRGVFLAKHTCLRIDFLQYHLTASHLQTRKKGT